METSLKTAVYDVLAAALSVSVYNGAPIGTAVPYVNIDEYYSDDWSTKTYTGTRVVLPIHVWTTGVNGSIAAADHCATIMKDIRTALDRVDLTVTGYNFVDGQFRSSRSFQDEDSITRHGIVEFEFLVHS